MGGVERRPLMLELFTPQAWHTHFASVAVIAFSQTPFAVAVVSSLVRLPFGWALFP